MFPNSKWISAGWLWLPASVRIPAGELFAAISRIGLWRAFFRFFFLFICPDTINHLPSRPSHSGQTGMQSAQVFRFTTTGEGIFDPSYRHGSNPMQRVTTRRGRAEYRPMVNHQGLHSCTVHKIPLIWYSGGSWENIQCYGAPYTLTCTFGCEPSFPMR